MKPSTRSLPRPAAAPWLAGAIALAGAIFGVDLITHGRYETAAFYAAVVLLSARFLSARGVLLAAAACAGLTALSRLAAPFGGSPAPADAINTLLSISFIGAATVLALRSLRVDLQLRDSEEQWKAVFEHKPTMFFMVEAAGTILSVNTYGAEQLGYTVDDLVGRNLRNLFHEDDRDAACRNAESCLKHLGQASSWELRKLRKNGEVLWVRETASAVVIRGRTIILIVCEDVTERKQAENLTGLVFEISPDGMCIIGRDLRYRRVNSVYGRIWSRPIETFVGMRVADLLGPELFDAASGPSLERCFAGEDVRIAGWYPFPTGRRYVSVSYSPLRLAGEEVEAALVITRDLTEPARAAEALGQARVELAHVNRVATMGQLAASIAHEINQPTAAVVTNAEAASRWLAKAPPDLAEARQAIERIVKNGGRVADVIARIRALIKKTPPRRVRFDFNEAVADVIGLTRAEAEKHGVAVRTRLAADLPWVAGDRVQIQQVVMNLIVNAIEAMQGVQDRPRELQLSSKADPEGGLRFAVRDAGPGLDPAGLDRLFEPFYTTKDEGMGMGLAICRSIIEGHGGRLWASANKPAGAVFQFVLPANGRTRAARAATSDARV